MGESNATTVIDIEAAIVGRSHAAADVIVLELMTTDTTTWTPGSHLEIDIPGVGARQYSLCGDPGDSRRLTVAILREPDSRGGSALLHDSADVGGILRVSGMRNHFELIPAPAYVFVAGGIGITPILPMIRQVDRDGADWRLVYLGRQKSRMPFLDVLEQLDAGRGRVVIHTSSDAGRYDLPTLLARPIDETLVYCCGPESLMAAVEESTRTWPRSSVHLERFAPKDTATHDGDQGFSLVLAESDLELWVPPERTALDVMLEAGVDIIHSCKEGTCGTCEVEIIQGEADHRDSILDEAERAAQEYMYVCVSRCLGPCIKVAY
jgi:ferredoxin-NADP reductase